MRAWRSRLARIAWRLLIVFSGLIFHLLNKFDIERVLCYAEGGLFGKADKILFLKLGVHPIDHNSKNFTLFWLVMDFMVQPIPDAQGDFISSGGCKLAAGFQ